MKVMLAGVIILFGALGVFHFSNSQRAESLPEVLPESSVESVSSIGTSVEGRSIDAHTYGDGDTHLLFVGGIHGGYEWNTVLLAYELIDYLNEDPSSLPEDLKVTVVPVLNPDGLFSLTNKEGRFALSDVPKDTSESGKARFNARGVDLNRNFDCKWQSSSFWRGAVVSAGNEPFSEPEAVALRDLVKRDAPDAVVFWHSQAGAVYGSECTQGILPATLQLMDAYATASGYDAIPAFTSYEVTGDAEGWLASIGIPALTVELESHETVEWEQNLKGVEALFNQFNAKE